MKILVAPLNWGLGHASRCVPIIRRLCREGHQVVLGGDGDALLYLQQHFPQLRSIGLAQLNLSYSRGKRQVGAMLRALPALVRFSVQDHRMLKRLQAVEHFDQVISDNRFGLYLTPTLNSIYITHQLHILLPRPYKWLEPLVSRMHARIYNRYDEVWVPDTPDHRLSGELSVPQATGDRQQATGDRPQATGDRPQATGYRRQATGHRLQATGYRRQATGNNSSLHHSAERFNSSFKFIGPLSRFSSDINLPSPSGEGQGVRLTPYKIVALFSGLEPHRTLMEQAVLERFRGHEQDVLLVNGKLDNPLSDSELAYYLRSAEIIIARSGYSTIMDLDALGVLDKAELIPTPGQPEQEYLAELFAK